MELFAAHGPRDLASTQFRADDIGERTTRAQYSLRVKYVRTVIFGFDESLDSTIIRVEANQTAQSRRDEQIAFDMASAPDEDLEPTLLGHRALIDLMCLGGMIVPIENDEAGQPGLRTTALAKIGQRARRSTPAQNDCVSLDGTRKIMIDAARPTRQDLTVSSAFDVENER